MVLFDVWAGEPGAPIFVPPAAATPGAAAASKVSFRLKVRPRRVRSGRRVGLHVQASFSSGGQRHPLAGALVRLAGRQVTTDSGGKATIFVPLRRAGTYRLHLIAAGQQVASASVRATRAPASGPRFTG